MGDSGHPRTSRSTRTTGRTRASGATRHSRDEWSRGSARAGGVGDLDCTTNQIIKWDDAQGKWLCSNELAALQTRLAVLESLLANVSRNGNDITISGANLHVVNGSGSTESANGLGNIIIGYNEQRPEGDENVRSGSHMLVVGKELNFTSFGAIVFGSHNSAGGEYASVSGGDHNTASGPNASVSGGAYNLASGEYASVSGGDHEEAAGEYDWRAGDALFSDK